MIGMDRTTGRRLSGIDHIKQSLTDILTTPINSVTMKRDYGSLLSELIDHPTNNANVLRALSATVMAISQWEPRVAINRVGFVLGTTPGQSFIDLEGSLVENSGSILPLALTIPVGVTA